MHVGQDVGPRVLHVRHVRGYRSYNFGNRSAF